MLSRVAGWATRTGPGAYSFDWGLAQRALDRPLSPFEQRILRESVLEAEDDDVQGLLKSLDAVLGE